MRDNLVTNGHHLISLESLRSVNKVATSSSALMTLALALVRTIYRAPLLFSKSATFNLCVEWIIQGCIKMNATNVSLGAPAAHSLQLYSRASAHLITCCGIQPRGANSNKFVARAKFETWSPIAYPPSLGHRLSFSLFKSAPWLTRYSRISFMSTITKFFSRKSMAKVRLKDPSIQYQDLLLILSSNLQSQQSAKGTFHQDCPPPNPKLCCECRLTWTFRGIVFSH